MKRQLWIAALCAAALSVTACTAKTAAGNGGPAASDPGVTATTITLGTSNALTGPVAAVCLPTSAGASAWFQQVNASGGVNGRQIEDTVLDDGYQAPRAAANLRTFQSDNVFALFGGCGTTTAAVIASAVKGTDLPYLFPYAALPALVQPAQPNVYALLPLYSDQSRSLVPYVLQRDGSGSVYAVTSEIPGYQDDVDGVKAGTSAGGGAFSGSTLLPSANAPAQQAALKVGAARPDYAMLTVLAPDAARLLNAMAAAGTLPRKAVLGVSVLASESFASALSPAAAALLQTASPTVPVSDARATACLAAVRKYSPGTTPDAFALYGCAAAQVFVTALKAAGQEPTRAKLEAVLNAMHNADASPLLPPVSFSAADHMGLHSMFLLTLHDGRFTAAGTLPITALG
jgi:branched-chain amino acid transport system substrate-binding protein